MRSRRFITGSSSERKPRPQEPLLSAASLMLFGLIIGLAAGLYYAWIVEPVSYIASGPVRLGDDDKEQYILLISESYAVDGDWDRAKERLDALGDPDISQSVTSQLEAYLRAGQPAEVLNKLAAVARRLGSQSPAVDLFMPVADQQVTATSTLVAVAPISTQAPTATGTGRATRQIVPSATLTLTPSPTPVPVFEVLKQERICRRNTPVPLIQVVVYDAFLEPIQGVEVFVRWESGSDQFFTGFHPDESLGYGDFTMEPETDYSVEIAIGSGVVEGLRVEECGDELGGLAGGWRITYQLSEPGSESSGS